MSAPPTAPLTRPTARQPPQEHGDLVLQLQEPCRGNACTPDAPRTPTGSIRPAGCEKLFSDIISGAKASRPGLDKALEQLRDGDTLVVWKLDRLGRSVKNLVAFTDELNTAGIGFRSLTAQIDTTSHAGRFFFHVMASLAQMERELTIERTRAGLEAARGNGRPPGRKRIMTDRKIAAARQLLAQGTSAADVAPNIGVSNPTLYRWIPATNR